MSFCRKSQRLAMGARKSGSRAGAKFSLYSFRPEPRLLSFVAFLTVVHRVIVARLAVFGWLLSCRRFLYFCAHFKPFGGADHKIGRLGVVLFTDRKMLAIVA